MNRLLARLAFLLSGVAGLTFELVWTRHLGLAIGATSIAIATITAAYMGGLALGSHIGGRIADRLERPLAVYGILELAVALPGFVIPAIALAVPDVDAALFGEASGFARALTRFLVAVVVLIVPTTLMGATLPILARAVTERLGTVGREVGTLYALNLAGAVIGAALAGFWFVPSLGRGGANAIAIGIDVLVGVIALVGGMRGAPFVVKAIDPLIGARSIRAGAKDVVALLAVTGASAMALQVLWTRAISTAIGPSTYAFSAIVCAYLLGLALGGAIASRLADGVKSLRFALACVLLTTGLAAMFGIAVVDDLPSILRVVVLDKNLTMRALFASEFGLAALCLMPATTAMGAIFPLSITAVIGSEEKLGSAVGTAYAVNTIGAIFGSFASVFVLIPTLGIERGMRLAAILYVIAALVLCFRLESFVDKSRSRTLAAACGLALAVIIAWHGWDIARWTAGVYRLSMTREYYSKNFKMADVMFHADGLSSTVTVETEDDVRWIKVDGKVDGSSVGDMPTQILSGLLPMMFHPAPKNVAVIGCGTGVTVGGALQGEPEHVTLIDIEHEVIEGAKLFANENHAPWADPRLTIVEDDGRNFLRRSTTAFDVIVSEPSNPWMAGASSLFTREFFTLAAKHIEPDHGLFLQWLQIYELAPERIASILKTFHAAFPEVYVFTANADSNDLLLVGSQHPITVDMERLQKRFDTWTAELKRAELATPNELLALLLVGNDEINAIADTTPFNTDDNAFIEFGAPRDLLDYAEKDAQLPWLEAGRGHRGPIVKKLLRDDDNAWPSHAIPLAKAYLDKGMLADAIDTIASASSGLAQSSSGLQTEARRLGEIATFLEADEDEAQIADDARAKGDPKYAELVRAAAKDNANALATLSKMPEAGSDPALGLLYAYTLYKAERNADAMAVLAKIDALVPDAEQSPAISYYRARAAYADAEYATAVHEMNRYRASLTRSLSASSTQY